MTTGTLSEVLRYLHRLTDVYGTMELTDGELLERFAARREEAAFAVLVQRHGPMVWGVCRRVLQDAHQAEDAFQATFLVLVRKARSIRKHESLGSWLYGVAYRVAAKARARAKTRSARERRFVEMPRPDPLDEMTWLELRAVLDEELSRLPEKYRAPVVLCYLEGKTHEQAARQLGCPRTSLSSRLSRARTLLQQRLATRGLALSAGLLATVLVEKAVAEVPALLLLSTIRAATHIAGAGAVSPQAASLAEGVLKTMSATRWILATVLVLVISATTALVLGRQPQAPQAQDLPPETAPASVPKEESPSLFRDVTPDSGVDFTYHNGEEADQFSILETIGGGVALLDYDGDGLLDIFLTGGGSFVGEDKKQIKGHSCKLYKNLGNWKFKDVTKDVGLDKVGLYTHGCAVVDYDCDGWPDLLVTGYGGLALFHNESDGKGGRRFVDVTQKAGLLDNLWSTSAAWADLDGDGYPDLYVCHYVDWSLANNPACFSEGKREVCPPKLFRGQPHKVYRNNGDGTFTDVSKEAGLRGPRTDKDYDQLNHLGEPARKQLQAADKAGEYGKGLGVIVVDLNDDGKPDIYVANDTVDNFLYINRSVPGKIRFEEMGLQASVARDDRGTPTASKGLAVGDYDNKGRPSLFVTNDEGELHSLFLNQSKKGREIFQFRSQVAGIARIGKGCVGWGTAFLDFDNDGWLDLFVVSGHTLRNPSDKSRQAQRPVLLRNRGGRFVPITDQCGPYFQGPHRGRGVACGDLDNDGRIDIVISHINEPVVLLRNEAKAANHWLGVELVGKKHRDVVGAKLTLEVEGLGQLTLYAKGGGSFACSSDPRHVFGLGTAKRVGKLTVRWPSGKEQSWEGLPVDRYSRLIEGE